MSEHTAIEWCDSTFNPWIGCTRVSPACDDCYAARSTPARTLGVAWGPGQPRRRTAPATWKQPLLWNREHEAFQLMHGRRRRVFCASLADVFDNEVNPAWRADLFQLIADTPNLDWLLLTKRIGNVPNMLGDYRTLPLLPNIWLGATVVNQQEADRDIPKLLAVPARVRFLSIEPMLGPIDLTDITLRRGSGDEEHFDALTFDGDEEDEPELGTATLDWVICGGESGPNVRPMHPDWARSLRDQCEAAGVPFLFKQWGCWRPAAWFDGPDADRDEGDDFVDLARTDHQFLASDGRTWDTFGGRYMYPPLPLGHWCLMVNEGKKAAGRLLDGREHNGFPEGAA